MESKAWKWEKLKSSYWETPCDMVVGYFTTLKNKGEQKALDVGCGIGRHAIFLAKNGWDVTAIDLSISAINYLNNISKKNNLRIHTYLSDMKSMPFNNESFDSVLAYHSIYHSDFSGVINNINEICRVLKKGGSAYVTLNSKKSSEWEKRTADSIVDDYTIVKLKGDEKNIPHTYVESKDFAKMFSKFSIIKSRLVKEKYKMQNSAHYHLQIIKN